MNTRITLAVLLFLSFTQVLAEGEIRTEVTFSQWCKDFTVEYFWQAFHPGEANRQKVYKGSLNEVTPGRGAECTVKGSEVGDGSFYVHGGSLINSQRGNTVVAGVGYQNTIVNLYGITVKARLEVAHLEYQVPRHDFQVARGYIPLPSVQLSYDFSSLPREVDILRKMGTIGIRQYFLPVDHITLTSIVWQVPFSLW